MPGYHFQDLPYNPPDFSAFQAKINDLVLPVRQATTLPQLLACIEKARQLQLEIAYPGNLAFIRCYQNCKDSYYAQQSQAVSQGEAMLDWSVFQQALVDSPLAAQLDEKLGPQYLDLIRTDNRIHGKGKDLQAKEAALIAQYQREKASLKIYLDGKEYSEAEINKLAESPDRKERKAAKTALFAAVLQKKEIFSDLLSQLVEVRIQLAKANGFEDYLSYINVEKGRQGYGEAELTDFCNQVKEHLVPFSVLLHKAQAKRLGLEKLASYDLPILFPQGNPQPVGDADMLIAIAQKMYDRMSPKIGHFFRQMVETGSIDVKASPDKISNMGFTTTIGKLPDGIVQEGELPLPFVFGNCNGTTFDTVVLTHELGHAYQHYLAMQAQPVCEYWCGPNDVAEVPSKAMEQFAYPWSADFYGDRGDDFKLAHMQGIVEEICSYCIIHEFESWLYTHPDATTKERAAKLTEISALYDPETDCSEFAAQAAEGALLFRNMAVYMFPHYVISYALSDMCALEFGGRMETDPAGTWQAYETLCTAGGSSTYPQLLALSGMKPAYGKGVVEKATASLRSTLTRLLQMNQQQDGQEELL